jgi:hypothetical protein
MIDLKKKCWREKVTAEITVAHLQQFAKELGTNMSAADAAVFLNEKGRAQAIWTHMMQAGEDFIKAGLARKSGLHTSRTAPRATTPANLSHKDLGAREHPPISYQ